MRIDVVRHDRRYVGSVHLDPASPVANDPVVDVLRPSHPPCLLARAPGQGPFRVSSELPEQDGDALCSRGCGPANRRGLGPIAFQGEEPAKVLTCSDLPQ